MSAHTHIKALLLSLFVCLGEGSALCAEEPLVVREIDNLSFGQSGELVLAVRLRDIWLSEGLFAQLENGTVYYPLGELAALLKFPIFVNPNSGRATGWFLDPSRSFELDPSTLSLRIAGDPIELAPGAFKVQDSDIYLSHDTLENCLPLKLELDLAAQLLTVRSTEDLPLELAKKRQQQQQGLVGVGAEFGAKREAKIPPYKFLDTPMVSTRLGFSYSKSAEQGGSESTGTDYRLDAYGDALWLNGQLSLSGTAEGGLNTAYLRLGRRYPDRNFAGPLRLSEIELGDIGISTPSLMQVSASGVGVKVSNRPLTRRFSVDGVDLDGYLQDGYEVELYLNGLLRDVYRDDGEGRYRFEGVPLTIGDNEIRLEFYGPNGERRTQRDSYYVSGSQNSFAEVFFDAAVFESGNTVFDRLNRPDDALDREAPLTAVAKVSIGLGGRSVVDATLVNEDGEKNSVDVALSTIVGGSRLVAETAIDPENRSAYGLSLRSTYSKYVGVLTLGYEQAAYGDEVEAAPALLQEDTWQLGAQLDRANRFVDQYKPTVWSLAARASGRKDNLDLVGFSGNLQHRRELSHVRVDLDYDKNLISEQAYSSGRALLRRAIRGPKNVSLSSEFQFELLPQRQLNAVDLAASWSVAESWSAGTRLGYLTLDESWTLSVGSQRVFKYFTGDTGAYYQSDHNYGLNMGVSFSAGKFPYSKVPYLRPYTVASTPRVGMVVFLDDNGNGRRDTGEVGLKGVGIAMNGLATSARTDAFGYAMVEGLSAHSKHDFSILPQSILDPSLRPLAPKFGVVSRPGRLPIVELPVIPTGEVEGYVNFVSDDLIVPAPNALIVLRKVGGTGGGQEIFSEFDGLYTLAGVPLGEYDLSVDPELLSKAGLESMPATRRISLGHGNSLWTGLDFELRRQRAEPVNESELLSVLSELDQIDSVQPVP